MRQVSLIFINLLSVRENVKNYQSSNSLNSVSMIKTIMDSNTDSGSKWSPFTEIQITLLRDSIFSILCSCSSLPDYPITVLIVWNIQVRYALKPHSNCTP